MQFIWLLFLYSLYCSQSLIAQQQFIRTSIYYAPFALLHSAQGPSIRGGVEQSVGRKLSLFAEGSYFIRKSRDYNDLEGYRFEAGTRYYLKPGWEDVENWDRWISLGGGKIHQTFTEPGILYDPSFTSSKSIVGILTRKVQFIHFGFGFRVKLIARLYIDGNLQIGFRHRDIDVSGLTETEDDDFRADVNSDDERFSKNTTDAYLPDCAFNLRIGFDIISRNK